MTKTNCIFCCCAAIVYALTLVVVPVSWATSKKADATWSLVHEELAKQSQIVAREAKTTKSIISKEHKALRAQEAALKAAIAREKKHLERQKKEFEALLAQEHKVRQDIEEHQEDIKTLETVVKGSAREADTMIHDSLVSPAFDQRVEIIAPLLEGDQFPSFADIEKLVGLYFQEAVETGNIASVYKDIVGPEGSKTSADVLRIGAFTAFYRLSDGRVGYLRTGKDGKTWIAVPASLGRKVRRQIQAVFEGESHDIPLDISRGAALQGLDQQKDILQWLRSGGVLVWPIIFVGVVALLLGIERLCILLRQKTVPQKMMQHILERAGEYNWQDCKKACGAMSRFPALRIIARSVDAAGSSKDVLEATLEEAILKEIPPLEKFLATLNILAAIAPLLGLLGTVTGMISTFQVITLYGTGDPRMMSGGISEALITTQLGLAVAIPIMLMHHMLQRRVETLVSDMEEKGTAFVAGVLAGKRES